MKFTSTCLLGLTLLPSSQAFSPQQSAGRPSAALFERKETERWFGPAAAAIAGWTLASQVAFANPVMDQPIAPMQTSDSTTMLVAAKFETMDFAMPSYGSATQGDTETDSKAVPAINIPSFKPFGSSEPEAPAEEAAAPAAPDTSAADRKAEQKAAAEAKKAEDKAAAEAKKAEEEAKKEAKEARVQAEKQKQKEAAERTNQRKEEETAAAKESSAAASEDVSSPEFSMPSFSAPAMPDVKMPAMPKFSMPKMPDMPKVELPDAGDAPKAEVKMPEMPKFSMPKTPDMPKMELPNTSGAPKAAAPAFSAPAFTAPKVPEFTAPKVPEFTAPKMPEFSAPKVSMPTFDAPKSSGGYDFDTPSSSSFSSPADNGEPQEVRDTRAKEARSVFASADNEAKDLERQAKALRDVANEKKKLAKEAKDDACSTRAGGKFLCLRGLSSGY